MDGMQLALMLCYGMMPLYFPAVMLSFAGAAVTRKQRRSWMACSWR